MQKLCKNLEEAYGREGEKALVFPSYGVAKRCREFFKKFSAESSKVRIVRLSTPVLDNEDDVNAKVQAHIAALFFPESEFTYAKQFWQHTGEIVSSRMAEFCLARLATDTKRTPSPPQKPVGSEEDTDKFVEERFGRNLDLSFADEAKVALRRRISAKINETATGSITTSENDVYLYPTGMNSIFSAHRAFLEARQGNEKGLKSVCYGFPYVDSLNILKKFGPGVHFYGSGESADLDDLEKKLEAGERILILFCEFPSNPLLKSPDIRRIDQLARKYDFGVVVDETVGNLLNVCVTPFADIVVSSLTKVFSGDSNVMGGSLVLNPSSRYYQDLKKALENQYEDIFWAEDAIYLERNSRDIVERNQRINENAEAVAALLKDSAPIKELYYPKYNPSKHLFDACKTADGGYGGLLSIVFHNPEHAVKFYDAVNTAKGPSLGTNFTLTSPYTILAHYGELDYVEQFGVSRHLVRISVGLEEQSGLLKVFEQGLSAIDE